jgi:diguanylate cyclase
MSPTATAKFSAFTVMDPLLDRLSTSVASAKTIEELTRPLLEMLESVTGLESTYLTAIDLEQGVQTILYSRNTSALHIPEELTVPWGDTLCKRALDAHQPYTDNVSECWGDSDAAKQLGIQTYLSTPVHLANGGLYGTLCAASSTRKPLPPQAQHVLTLFATLIAHHIEREHMLAQLMHANERLATYASTDPLTELNNRRSLQQELTRMLAHGTRRKGGVLVAYIDLDGFKAVNDTHGHAVGDQFLVEIATRLRNTLRAEDMAARIGGDEFIVIGPGPLAGETLEQARQAFEQRIFLATVGEFTLGGHAIRYQGASVGVLAIHPGTLDAASAIQRADAAMYAVKLARKQAALSEAPV